MSFSVFQVHAMDLQRVQHHPAGQSFVQWAACDQQAQVIGHGSVLADPPDHIDKTEVSKPKNLIFLNSGRGTLAPTQPDWRALKMLHALTWFTVVGLVLAWSVTAWALHALASWVASESSSIVVSKEAIRALAMPDWLAPWMSAEAWSAVTALMGDVGPLLDGVLAALPTLGGPVSVLVWVCWAVGTFLLVVLGLVTSGLILQFQRKQPTWSPAWMRLGSDSAVR